ncbi:hypothetical protein MESS4_330095 [Mesorhizobium sp. STM 4661]|nr:hypothetical protein MESS4_330095 [Mesorhizobium sp. STM 4661]
MSRYPVHITADYAELRPCTGPTSTACELLPIKGSGRLIGLPEELREFEVIGKLQLIFPA